MRTPASFVALPVTSRARLDPIEVAFGFDNDALS
jgi:hypothetical protein